MLAKLSIITLVTFVATAIATPSGYYGHHETKESTSTSCSNGSTVCCDQMSAPSQGDRNRVAALFGGNIGSFTGNIGGQCTPISGFGAGFSGNCATNAACCQHYDSKKLVGANCTPLAGQV